MHDYLFYRSDVSSSLAWLLFFLVCGLPACHGQRLTPRPNRGPGKAPDQFQSFLDFVREEQELEFAKPLPEFPATVQGAKLLEKHVQAAYPSKKELAVYSLDWEPTLAAARKRAKLEQRPIFFIVVTNYTGPTNFFSGHC